MGSLAEHRFELPPTGQRPHFTIRLQPVDDSELDRRGRDLGDLGDELDGAGPSANHGHPLAGQAYIVVPAGGVPPGPGDVGQGGTAELAEGADDCPGLQGASAAGGTGPVLPRPQGR